LRQPTRQYRLGCIKIRLRPSILMQVEPVAGSDRLKITTLSILRQLTRQYRLGCIKIRVRPSILMQVEPVAGSDRLKITTFG
jgi:hypothetical protein